MSASHTDASIAPGRSGVTRVPTLGFWASLVDRHSPCDYGWPVHPPPLGRRTVVVEGSDQAQNIPVVSDRDVTLGAGTDDDGATDAHNSEPCGGTAARLNRR